MIPHENDVNNHRTMWLLIVQGLIAAVVADSRESREMAFASVGILVSFGAAVKLTPLSTMSSNIDPIKEDSTR